MKNFFKASKYLKMKDKANEEVVTTLEQLSTALRRSAKHGMCNLSILVDKKKIELFRNELLEHGYKVSIYYHQDVLEIEPRNEEDDYFL